MAFGVPSFTGLHYEVFDLYAPFLAIFSFFNCRDPLTGVEMRRKTPRDFSISSERKWEHRGGLLVGMDKISYILGVFIHFFHSRMVVLIFQLPDWGIMVQDCIRASPQLPLCKWYPSPKQWIHLQWNPISALKWGLGVLNRICAIPEYLIMVLSSSKREIDTRPVQQLRSCVLSEHIDCRGFV